MKYTCEISGGGALSWRDEINWDRATGVPLAETRRRVLTLARVAWRGRTFFFITLKPRVE